MVLDRYRGKDREITVPVGAGQFYEHTEAAPGDLS